MVLPFRAALSDYPWLSLSQIVSEIDLFVDAYLRGERERWTGSS